MRTSLKWSVFVAGLALVLGGCASPVSPAASDPPVTTASPTPSATSEQAPSALVLHVSGVTLEDGEGNVVASAARDSPDDVVALITSALGAPTSSDPNGHFGAQYKWGDAVAVSVPGWAIVRFSAPTAGEYDLRAEGGIVVGSTRSDVLALSPVDDGYDGDGDGKSDTLGFEAQPEPGTESLTHPGQVGTSYIGAIFDGDSVSAINSPSGDWMDV